MQPFWEKDYNEDGYFAFGNPSFEVIEQTKNLPPNATVLDIGCGDGRHAIYLAKLGFNVEAIDISESGIAKINRYKELHQLHNLKAYVQDAATYPFEKSFDLIISHGVFHFMPRDAWEHLIHQMKKQTNENGCNIITVFTDEVPIPDDLAPFVHGIFKDGELQNLFNDWTISLYRSYTFEDEHENNIHHCHAANKLVAIKPFTGKGETNI